MKKLLSVLFAILIVCSISVFSGCKDNKTDVGSDATTESVEETPIQTGYVPNNGSAETWDLYQYEDGTYYINGYNGSEKIVQVPSEIDGLKVTGLTGNAFYMNEVVEEVYLPETIVTISSHAFSKCKTVKKVHLPDTIQYIGEMAFAHCDNLKEIVLPRDLEYIGDNAFTKCINLSTVTFNCEKLTNISGKCFSYSGIETVTIPDCVTTIEDSFLSCQKLTKVYIPDSVTSMDCSFMSSPNVVIYGTPGSYADRYAQSKNHEFVAQ